VTIEAYAAQALGELRVSLREHRGAPVGGAVDDENLGQACLHELVEREISR
jgi:hypothetical protein